MEFAKQVSAAPILRHAFINAELEQVVLRLSATSPSKITLEDIAWIAASKTSGSARIARERVLSNDEATMRQKLTDAHSTDDSVKAIGGLVSLYGLGVATASAVLSWTRPDKWPVLDIHAWDALHRLQDFPERNGSTFRIEQYGRYCSLVVPSAKKLGWTPREVDRWLYSFGKAKLLGEHLELREVLY